jgi:hypothetical protein
MIDNIILEYLRTNKRLVVPELGSFIRKEGGETVFAEFLKKDDGVLTGLLAKEYGLEPAEAAEAASGYADSVRRTVAASGRYVVEGVGVLHTDANGQLALEGAGEPKRSVSVVEEVITVVEPEPEPEPMVKPEPVVEPEPEPEPEPELEVVWRQEEVEVVVPEPVRAVKPEPVVAPEPEPVWESAKENHKRTAFEPIEEKKAFTLNDLYAVPEEENIVEHHNFWLGANESQKRTASAVPEEENIVEHHNFWLGANENQKRAASAVPEDEEIGGWFGGSVYQEPDEPMHREPASSSVCEGAKESQKRTASAPHKHKPQEHEHHAIRPPQIRRPAKRTRSRIDIVMIIAIVAAVVALSSLLLFTRSGDVAVRRSTQQVVDTLGVEVVGVDATE